MAEAVGDESMAEVFRAGKDLHEETARRVLGIWDRPLTDAERQVGKTWNFLTIYGGGPYKAQTMLNSEGYDLSLEECRAQRDLFHETWPGLKLLHNPPFQNGGYKRGEGPGAIQRALKDKGYLTTLAGRHLHPRKAHAALNAVVQGSAGELARMSLVKVHRKLSEDGITSHLVNVVHDELMLDCIEDELPYLVAVVPPLMDHAPVSKVVPIETSTEISFTTWANKEDYEDTENETLSAGDHGEPDHLGLIGSRAAA